MGFLEGRMESLLEETSGSSGSGGSDASGDGSDDRVSEGVGLVAGALAEVMRTLGARGPGTSDYMLRTLGALVE